MRATDTTGEWREEIEGVCVNNHRLSPVFDHPLDKLPSAFVLRNAAADSHRIGFFKQIADLVKCCIGDRPIFGLGNAADHYLRQNPCRNRTL